jgi:hypothetical protein
MDFPGSPINVEVTSKRNGKIVGILQLTAALNGHSIHVVVENSESNSSSSYEMLRQK